MAKVLIVVDTQEDFIYGPLGTPEAQAIVPNVNKKIKECESSGKTIIFTRDTHHKDYLETTKYGNSNFSPYTRDTFGYAIKATYGEDRNGNPIMIQKQPKALSWKKSHKGCIIVSEDGESYIDGLTFEEAHGKGVKNLLQKVFENGKMIKETSLKEVRNRLYNNF